MQRSLGLLFQCILFLMFPLFQKYLNLQVRTRKLGNSVVYHPCPSRLASNVHLFIYVSPFVGKIFQFMAFTFLENALNLYIFTHAPVPHSKLQVEFFENLFPPRQKGGGNYDLLYQNSIRKYEYDLEH